MATNEGKPDVQAALAVLKAGFGHKIPDKIQEIRQSWDTLKTATADTVTFTLMHRQSHTLAGTAGTYGFDEVSRLAKAIELLLQDELTEHQNTWTAMGMENLEALLRELEAFDEDVILSQAKDIQVEMVEPAPLSKPVSPKQSKLIYIVDDDADFLGTMSMQIETFGYDVVPFTSLPEFSEAVAEQDPALVIMDVEFGQGKKTGIQHINLINAGRKIALQTIFMTSSTDVLTRLEAVRAGGLGYFTKPVLIEKLVDTIDDFTHQVVEEPYKIVIVDDSPEQSAFAALTLQQAGMHTREVNKPLELLNQLIDFPPDLILTDLYMPECSGLELSKIIRQMDAYVSVPIVFLSSEHNQKKQMGAMSLGGDDFLSKPVQPWHLVSAVTSRVKRGRKIRGLTETDGLTGLFNHTKSKERLEEELYRAKREKTPLSFAMLDIDFFKYVNDNHGHPAGDRVLKSLANMFKQRLRQYDTIGRYGGEEFVVILPNTDAETAKMLMDHLRVSFSEINHYSEVGIFSCNFSCGIASFPEFKNGTILNDEADKALYVAKKSGRNRVIIAP